MTIKILGPGCPKCKTLETNVREALRQTGLSAEVKKVTGLNDILKYNVVMTPALVIDEVVKSSGKLLSPEQIKQYLVKQP